MILIVDDSLTNRLLLRAMLREAGYKDILMAQGALEALDVLSANVSSGHDSLIDLVLMDIVMPDLDGIQACRRIKETECIKDIPVIMVTGRTQVKDLDAAFAAGAMDYVTKPVNKIELIARARSALRLKRETDVRKQREKELLRVTDLLEQANKKLHVLSSSDGLTGIANRRQFDEVLSREWKRAARYNSPLSLILADIDFFKPYNDTYGHKVGDECLKEVATCIAGSVSRSEDLVARYGGEEFGIILPNTDLSGLTTVANTVRSRVEGLKVEHSASSVSPYVTISVGGASIIPSQFFSPAILITTADKAMYRAKQAGRNRAETSEIAYE